MDGLRATILGCGPSHGVPRIGPDWGACDASEPRNRRSRCALLVERPNRTGAGTTVLVDSGPDVRTQLLDAGVNHLDGVLFTHPHADHIHGLDDLRAFWLTSKRRVDIYADAATSARLDEAFSYCFRKPPGSSYPPVLKQHIITPFEPIVIKSDCGSLDILPLRQTHGDIGSLAFRFGGLAYACDVSDFPPETVRHLYDLEVLIIDALRYTGHPSHFSVDEALAWIDRLKPNRAILTHMHSDLDYASLKRALPHNVEPAHDGMRIDF